MCTKHYYLQAALKVSEAVMPHTWRSEVNTYMVQVYACANQGHCSSLYAYGCAPDTRHLQVGSPLMRHPLS